MWEVAAIIVIWSLCLGFVAWVFCHALRQRAYERAERTWQEVQHDRVEQDWATGWGKESKNRHAR